MSQTGVQDDPIVDDALDTGEDTGTYPDLADFRIPGYFDGWGNDAIQDFFANELISLTAQIENLLFYPEDESLLLSAFAANIGKASQAMGEILSLLQESAFRNSISEYDLHELNNILSSKLYFSAMRMRAETTGELVLDDFKMIKQIVGRINNYIDVLKTPTGMASINFAQLIKDRIERFKGSNFEITSRLNTLETCALTSFGVTDARAVIRALNELITNSIKYYASSARIDTAMFGDHVTLWFSDAKTRVHYTGQRDLNYSTLKGLKDIQESGIICEFKESTDGLRSVTTLKVPILNAEA